MVKKKRKRKKISLPLIAYAYEVTVLRTLLVEFTAVSRVNIQHCFTLACEIILLKLIYRITDLEDGGCIKKKSSRDECLAIIVKALTKSYGSR